MEAVDFATESVFTKNSEVFCKWQCRSLFLVKLKDFSRNEITEFVAYSVTESFLV